MRCRLVYRRGNAMYMHNEMLHIYIYIYIYIYTLQVTASEPFCQRVLFCAGDIIGISI